jgi:hypothetical protein
VHKFFGKKYNVDEEREIYSCIVTISDKLRTSRRLVDEVEHPLNLLAAQTYFKVSTAQHALKVNLDLNSSF